MSPPCSSWGIRTQNTSSDSTAMRKVKAAPISWIAEMPVQTVMAASLLCGKLVWIRAGGGLVGLDLRCRLHARRRLMQDDAVEQAELTDPRLAPERAHRVGVTCLPALTNASRREVDVLGVVLVLEPRAQQPDHVHPRVAVIPGQFLVERVVLFVFRNVFEQLRDDMPQLVRL